MDFTIAIGLPLVSGAVGLVAWDLALDFVRRRRRERKAPMTAKVELVDAKRLGKLLNVRPATIQDWGASGRIPRVVLSPKTIRFDVDAVLAQLGLSRAQLGLKRKTE